MRREHRRKSDQEYMKPVPETRSTLSEGVGLVKPRGLSGEVVIGFSHQAVRERLWSTRCVKSPGEPEYRWPRFSVDRIMASELTAAGIPLVLCNSDPAGKRVGSFCSPALLPAASPFLQPPTDFDPFTPVLNVNSFEAASGSDFYTGIGPRVQNFPQPGYSDFDIGLEKSVHITERFRFQLRGDAFNVFNAHHFNNVGTFIQSGGSGAVHSTPMLQVQTSENGMEA